MTKPAKTQTVVKPSSLIQKTLFLVSIAVLAMALPGSALLAKNKPNENPLIITSVTVDQDSEVIAITGQNFGELNQHSTVLLGNSDAPLVINQWGDEYIEVELPDIDPGDHLLVVSNQTDSRVYDLTISATDSHAGMTQEQLEALCTLYDLQQALRPSFCPPISPKLVFVSSLTYTGNLGGFRGADDICNELASSNGLSERYRAWITVNYLQQGDRFRMPTPANVLHPYYRPDGELVAENWSDLTNGSLLVPINVNEHGDEISYSTAKVWTNTYYSGDTVGDQRTCQHWSSAVGQGGIGDPYATNEYWSYETIAECDQPQHLYCIEY